MAAVLGGARAAARAGAVVPVDLRDVRGALGRLLDRGLWLSADSPLQHSIVETIANAVPGLIDLGDGRGGAINVGALLSARVFGWDRRDRGRRPAVDGDRWFGAARSAVRALLGEPERPGNPLLLKLSDLGLAVGFGVAVLVSAALSLGSTSLLDTVLGWLGADESSGLAVLASRGAGLVVTLAFDFGVLVGLYRVLAPSVPPRRALLGGALLTAVGLGMLKALGGALLGGASSNPLLTSFAVFVGLLVWFNLVCQVILLGAAWIAEARSPARQQMPLPDVGGPA